MWKTLNAQHRVGFAPFKLVLRGQNLVCVGGAGTFLVTEDITEFLQSHTTLVGLALWSPD